MAEGHQWERRGGAGREKESLQRITGQRMAALTMQESSVFLKWFCLMQGQTADLIVDPVCSLFQSLNIHECVNM